MPTPKNINIKFTASGNAIGVIEKLSKVQGTLTKVNQKTTESQKKLVDAFEKQAKALREIEYNKLARTLD